MRVKIKWKKYSEKEDKESGMYHQCNYYLPLNDKKKTEYSCLRKRGHRGNHRTTQLFLPVEWIGRGPKPKVPYISIDGNRLSKKIFL